MGEARPSSSEGTTWRAAAGPSPPPTPAGPSGRPCSAGAPPGSPAPTSWPGAGGPAGSSRPATSSGASRGRSRWTGTASTSADTASSPSSRRSRRLWEDMLGDDFLERPRLSRIYYQGRFLAYPLQARDVLDRLGVVESARCALSYLRARPAAAARRRDVRGVGDGAFRAPPLRGLLPLLHREGLGHPGVRDPRRVGGPAHQGLLARQRAPVRAAPAAVAVHDDDRALPLSPARPRTDVAGLPGPRRAGGHRGRSRDPVRRDPARRRARVAVVVDGPGGRAEHAVDGVLSSIPLGELVARMSPRRPTRCSRRPAGCGTARCAWSPS